MMKWLKLYSEARTDAKLNSLTDAQHRVWFNLMCFANEQPERGIISGYDDELLAVEVARGDINLLAETLERLQRLRIIVTGEDNLTFINFAKRQYEKPSDQPERVRERVKRHRDKQCNANVTPCNALDQDIDIDINNNNNDHSKLPVVNLVTSFEQETGRPLSPMNLDQIRQWEKQYPSELILEALRKAITLGKYSMQYIDSILLNWQKNNIRTLAEVKAADKEFEQRKQKGGKSRGRDSPPVKKPDNADYANWSRPRE